MVADVFTQIEGGALPIRRIRIHTPLINRMDANIENVPIAESSRELREDCVVSPHLLGFGKMGGEQNPAYGCVGKAIFGPD